MEKLHGKLSVKRLFGLVNIGEGRPSGDLQAKTVTPGRSQIVVTPDAEYYGLSHVTVDAVALQDKTVAPGSSAQIVKPDEGSVGLGSVTVSAAPLQQKTVTPAAIAQEVVTDAGFYGMEKVTVEAAPLQEITVTPGSEKLELTPDEDYIGFSKVTVEAVEVDDSGGDSGGDIIINGGAAEDTTFGDEYLTETGNYDYSSGMDENPSYIPEIPSGQYQILFRISPKAGRVFRYYFNGTPYEVTTTSDCYICLSYNDTTQELLLFGASAFYYAVDGGSDMQSSYNTMFGVHYAGLISTSTEWWPITGVPKHDCGTEDTTSDAAMEYYLSVLGGTYSETDGAQFIAFCSDSPIYFDGENLTNADGSPLTIYEVDAADKNTWVEIGTTDGTNYPVGSYTLTWNSHDTLDMTGQYVTHSKSDDPIAETVVGGDVGTPVERNETYSIEGSTMNSLVSAAQTVTGSKEPLTPTAAAGALKEYQSQPAEELTF